MSMNGEDKFASEYLKLVEKHGYHIYSSGAVHVGKISKDPKVLLKNWVMLFHSGRAEPRWIQIRLDNDAINLAKFELEQAEAVALKHDQEYTAAEKERKNA